MLFELLFTIFADISSEALSDILFTLVAAVKLLLVGAIAWPTGIARRCFPTCQNFLQVFAPVGQHWES